MRSLVRANPGSARVSRASASPARTSGVAPKQALLTYRHRPNCARKTKVGDREGALANTQDARAPQT